MIRHIWSVLCRRAIVDSGTNNLTISDVLEELSVDIKVEKKNIESLKLINLPLEFEIVSFWKKEGDPTSDLKAESEVEVINPEGKSLQTFKQQVNLPPKMRRLRTILRVMGLTLDNSGDYTLKVTIKEEHDKAYQVVSEIPLQVQLNKQISSVPAQA